jgi:hypothetical protein
LNSKCTVKAPDGPTDAFKISTGVQQGCVLAPFIFVMLMDYLLRKSIRDSCGVPMPVSYENDVESVGVLCDLEYADNLALFAKTVDGIQEKLNALADNSERLGLRINTGKTEYFVNDACPDGNAPLVMRRCSVIKTSKFIIWVPLSRLRGT